MQNGGSITPNTRKKSQGKSSPILLKAEPIGFGLQFSLQPFDLVVTVVAGVVVLVFDDVVEDVELLMDVENVVEGPVVLVTVVRIIVGLVVISVEV